MHKLHFDLTALLLVVFSLSLAAQTDPVDRPAPEAPGTVTFESSVGNVLFPHDFHVDDLKLGCVACHHQIHASALTTPHPGYLASSVVNCQGCHDTEETVAGNYYKCSACHHAEPANISDETLSSKVVTHKSCWKCHVSGTGVDASKGCGDCHLSDEN